MEQSKLFSILREAGCPVTYREFPPGEAPSLPYIVFYQSEVVSFLADNHVYRFDREYTIEICSEAKNVELENRIFDTLDKYEIVWAYAGETRTDEGIYVSYIEI